MKGVKMNLEKDQHSFYRHLPIQYTEWMILNSSKLRPFEKRLLADLVNVRECLVGYEVLILDGNWGKLSKVL
jgi:hypothetical protein